MKSLKQILDYYADLKNCDADLFGAPDPLQVAKGHRNDVVALICALFAYGSAAQILKFLHSLDFSLLDGSDERIGAELAGKKYRFQSPRDVAEIFITLKRLKNSLSIEDSVLCGMQKSGRIEDGINFLIGEIYRLNPYRSPGYEFFFGRGFAQKPTSPYKRYNLFLRWAVRDSDIDLGLYKKIEKSRLLIPLDTHTHKVSLKLGLIDRKSYDFEAVLQLTQSLRRFDPSDPVKYDFALYRLGQSGEIDKILPELSANLNKTAE